MSTDAPTNLDADPVAKAIAMLDLLAPDVRQQVMDRMSPEMRERVQNRIDSTPEGSRPHGGFSDDVAARRQLLRETAARLQDRKVADADATAERLALLDGPVAGGAMPMPAGNGPVPVPGAPGTVPAMSRPGTPGAADAHPLAPLASVHPAALARAMQGERAEAWAIVLDRLEPNVRAALQMYLDGPAQQAIDRARVSQAQLAPQLAMTIERAIARTVVPRAMREQRMLFTPQHYPQGA